MEQETRVEECEMEEERDLQMTPHGGMKQKQLAHVYMPRQEYEKAYCPQDALHYGTLFPELWGVYKIPE